MVTSKDQSVKREHPPAPARVIQGSPIAAVADKSGRVVLGEVVQDLPVKVRVPGNSCNEGEPQVRIDVFSSFGVLLHRTLQIQGGWSYDRVGVRTARGRSGPIYVVNVVKGDFESSLSSLPPKFVITSLGLCHHFP